MLSPPMSVHLLVVDDDDVDRERVLRLLGRTTLQFEAMEASSSASALTLLRTHEFDCVMLDNQLGDASGAELLPAIRRESLRDCPVIMITGAGNESLAVQALQHGAADYLTKYQLSADMLARAIERALENHRMRAELDDLHQRLEQRVAQQAAAIRQSERDLRAILDHTPTVIGYWDNELRNRFGNRAHQRWLGVDPERLPGRHLADVYGASRLAPHMPRIEAVLRGESQTYEQPFLASDGITLRHAQHSLHPDIGDDGKVRGFYSSIHDVTAIRQAQARAEELAAFNETLFAQSPVGLGVFDDAGRCAMANPALARLFNAAPAELVGLTLEAMMVDDALQLAATGRATVADGHPRRLDVDLRTAFGPRLQAACAWARVERDGRPQALLAAQNISDQLRTHEALVAARDAAERATRTKSEFLANMSHEIRTPMNAIVGLSRMALEDSLPAEARGFIEKVYHAAQALMGILDDVLDYSKVEAGQLRIEHLPLDIEQVVQRAVDLFSARIEQKGLALLVELAPDLPRCVLGDPLRLSQVLTNLLGNAVKFTERGHVRLAVEPLRGHSPAPDMIRFSVLDSGIGIDPAHREALFEAFSQADTSITRRFGGTGLGLSICRRLVGMMHGSIGFDSQPGQGSEFWFTARLDRAPVDLPELPDQPPARQRVLVASGDADQARELCRHLRSWRARVWTAASAADLQALLLCWSAATARRPDDRKKPFDAVLVSQSWLDAQDGDALLRALRSTPDLGRPKVIALVARSPRLTPDGPGSRPGPDATLRRPVLPAALRRVLSPQAADEPRADVTPGPMPMPEDGSAAPLRPAPLQGVRVLLVEDNETNQLLARVFLERLGATVRVAGDGAAALTLLQAEGPAAADLVLMDLQMPVMDGLEATRRIRALPALRDLPVIGMTAAAMPEDRARCLEAGMVDHLTKPMVADKVLEALLAWSGHRQQRQSRAGGLDIPGFDLTALNDLLRGNRQLLARILRRFVHQEADAASAVAAQIAQDDRDAACARLHRLRGGAGTLGATAVADTAYALEQALRQHRPLKAPLEAFTSALKVAMAAAAQLAGPEP